MLRTKKIRLILALAIVFAAVSLIVAVMVKVEQGGAPVKKPEPLPRNVEMALQKAHYTEVRDGIKKWDLFADQALFDKSKETFHLKGVRLIITSEKRTGDITLTADKAEYYSKTKDVELAGNVMAGSDSGLRFSSEKATYFAEKSLIKTDFPVRFNDGRIEINGVGMEFKTATRDLKIMNDVTADIKSGPSK